MKLELLTNATVVDDAIRFVSANSKNTITGKPETNDNTDPFAQANIELKTRAPDYKAYTQNTNQVF